MRPEVPKVSDPAWSKNPVDAFVFARLQKEGLHPSPEADKATLVRRVTLDLTGLPPTIEEVDDFLADNSPGAYERLVDRLLASPAYGERWAQVWLDAARYADSKGYADDNARTIWKYRDWVIRAINANKPFDQFTVEQIAGDLLPDPAKPAERRPVDRDGLPPQHADQRRRRHRRRGVPRRRRRRPRQHDVPGLDGGDDGVRQCHDHKYDPISQEEYFRVFAIFNQTEDADRRDEAARAGDADAGRGRPGRADQRRNREAGEGKQRAAGFAAG